MSVCTSNMNSSALSVSMETPLHTRQISNNNLSSTNNFLLLSPVNVRIEINFLSFRTLLSSLLINDIDEVWLYI